MRKTRLAALLFALFWAALFLLAAARRGDGGSALPGAADCTQTEALPDAAAPEQDAAGEASPPENAAKDPAAPTGASVPAAGFDAAFRIPVLCGGRTVSMDLHSYLSGVLLAEMPLSFADEALKAQAVACRTYALRSYTHRRHGSAALCTESGCCQGWRDPALAAPEERARAEAAVSATDGLAIYYAGELIDATFFACSGGQTESAAAVWGSELPYLQAVESPGEETAAHFTDELRVPLAEFRAALEELDGAVSFPEALGGWVGEIRYTPGGGVDEIELGGRLFSGKALRKRFGLRSTAFTLELTAEEAVFTTRGWGHRVGMSQYGAEAMARAGSSFEEILKWYYRGVELRRAG